LSYQGKPVKASRLFAGNDHEEQVKRLVEHFNKIPNYYTQVQVDTEIIRELQKRIAPANTSDTTKLIKESVFAKRDLSEFNTYEEAYHQLIHDIISQQYASTQLVVKGTHVQRLFVDGGFSKNPIYMNLLAAAFPGLEVFAASMAQATAMGTALSIHRAWNTNSMPNDIIELKYYSVKQDVLL